VRCVGRVSVRPARRSRVLTTEQKLAWLAASRPGVIVPVLWQPATSVKVSASGGHLSHFFLEIISLPLQYIGDGCRSPRTNQLPFVEHVDNDVDGLQDAEDERQPAHVSYA
jgi:hypothetical protein